MVGFAVALSAAAVDLKAAFEVMGIDERRAKIPDTDHVRGVLFKMTEDAIARAGPSAVTAFRHLAAPKKRWPFRMYPVLDYIEETAVAAAVLRPEDPLGAIREIWRETAKYAPVFNAERFLAMLRIDALGALRWLEQQRAMFCNYGSWRLEEIGPESVVMHYFDEWIWVDAAHRGGLEGVLRACHAVGSVDVVLESSFQGHARVRWGAAAPR